MTHIATKTEADVRRLEEEAQKQFSGRIDKRNIFFVDSKAELYAKHFSSIEDINAEISRLDSEGMLDDFVESVYNKTMGWRGSGDSADFIKKMQEKSRFDQNYEALDTFGRKAHYILLAELLDSISENIITVWKSQCRWTKGRLFSR